MPNARRPPVARSRRLRHAGRCGRGELREQTAELAVAREALEAAEYGYQDSRDQVILMVGATYLQTVAQAARVRSAEAQHETALALHAQAVDRLNAGTTPAIDALRAKVQLQTRAQQLIAARNDLAKQKLTLARLIGYLVQELEAA